MKKTFLITGGLLSLFLGSLGIILPGLPTTPFLLLSAWCFAQSSEKFHAWLVNHKLLGMYIRDYKETGGIRISIKFWAILFMIAGLALSFYQLSNKIILTIITLLVLTGTLLLTVIIPTAPSRKN